MGSMCGSHCTGCSFIESHGCGGCVQMGGRPYHGECMPMQFMLPKSEIYRDFDVAVYKSESYMDEAERAG